MKKYIFEFTEKGKKCFLSFPKRIREQIEKKLRFFISSNNPFDFAKPIKGSNKFFRFRIGSCRVIFVPKDKGKFIILLILKAGHRRDIYK